MFSERLRFEINALTETKQASDIIRAEREHRLPALAVSRGIGIGRRLIAEAIEFATRAGYDTLQLELYDVMKTARQLFHGAGFRHISEMPDGRFGRGLQRQLWRVPLKP